LRTEARSSLPRSFDFALLHQRLKHRCFVALSHRQQEGHGLAIALTAQMNPGAKSTFAIAQCFGVGITAAGPSRVLMRSDHAAIDKVELSVKLACSIRLLLQLRQNLLPQSTLTPSIEAS
jgi:hypothetical protein